MARISKAAVGTFAVVTLAALAAALAAVGTRKPRVELDVLGELPAFSFTDQNGRPFGDRDLRGHITVASFIFTRCPTICPVVTMKLARLEKETRDIGALRIVSFSVDPEHDTPAVLTEFAHKFRADLSRWSFVTGPAQEMRERVESSLKIAMDRRGTLPNGTPDIVHGTHLVLLDADLHIRGYYDSDDPARLQDLARDAGALADLLQ